jgi:hypothetical protein
MNRPGAITDETLESEASRAGKPVLADLGRMRRKLR